MTSENGEFKRAIFEQIARLGKVFSSATRLEILALLEQGPRTVQVLADELGQSAANTSQHLKALKDVRLVESEKEGLHNRYRIADEKVGEVLAALEELAEARLLEMRDIVERYFSGRTDVESVPADELFDRLDSDDVTLVDVRPREEYEASHLPGAVSVPLEELEDRIDELPSDGKVVAYCRGPYCVMSLDAVEKLRARNIQAVRLEEGVREWQRKGFSVEEGG